MKTKTKPAPRPTAGGQPAHLVVVDANGVRQALERVASSAPADAVEALLSAWRNSPCEEIANVLDAIALPPECGDVTSGGATDALARLLRLKDMPRDPRMSKLLVSWVANPPYHATGSKPFHTLMHEELARHSDPRAIRDLAAAAKAGSKRINGKVMKAWVVERTARTIATLRAMHPSGGVPPLPKGLASTLASAKKAAIAAAKIAPPTIAKSSSTSRGDELLEAVRQNPADDGARAVYADYLIEQGDPRGEFITLQLAHGREKPDATQYKREIALLRKNGRRWLGELGHIVGRMSGLSVDAGPGSGWIRFGRGFLVGCPIGGSKAKQVALTGHPDLATVEDIWIRRKNHVAFLDHPNLRSLVRLTTSREVIEALPTEALSCAKKLTALSVIGGENTDTIADVVCSSMPSLRTISLDFRFGFGQGPNRLDRPVAFLRDLLHRGSPSLVRVEGKFVNYLAPVFERSEGGVRDWKVTFLAEPNAKQQPLAERLRALCT